MKHPRKIYDELNVMRRSVDKYKHKPSFSSLDKYSKSPYLQRVINHTNKKNKKDQQTEDKDEVLSNREHAIHTQKQEQSTQLPKLVTPMKYKEEQSKNNFKTQLRNYQNKSPIKIYTGMGSHSATLEVKTKRKKLQPITQFKIRSAFKTKAGTNGKQTKTNQDMPIIDTKFPFGLKLYCVCDGHGLNGHLVSSFLKSDLIKNLNSSLKKCNNPPQIELLKKIITEALHRTNQNLLACDINTQLSGSTLVAVFIYTSKLISFNIGDSRAILVSQKVNQLEKQEKQLQEEIKNDAIYKYLNNQKKNYKYRWSCQALTSDQKPEREDEKQRILKNGGRVFAQTNEKGEALGPLRVWMMKSPMPGLAMTRSMGDKAGLKAGTSADPQIQEFEIKQQNKFMIVASDGVWEYLQNQEVMNMVTQFYIKDDLELACEKVVKVSTQVWHRVSFSRDDITLIIVALNPAMK